MTSPARLADALRAHAQGIYCREAAAELLIAQFWLHRSDFTGQFISASPGHATLTRPTATIDWPAVISALNTGSLPCSGGERRMLRITASLADGIPVDLQEALTGIDGQNAQLLVAALLHATGQPLPHQEP